MFVIHVFGVSMNAQTLQIKYHLQPCAQYCRTKHTFPKNEKSMCVYPYAILPRILSMIRAIAPSPVTLPAVPKLSIAI